MLGDPYLVLGIPHDASATEIRAAYLQLARQYHPDLNPRDRHAEERLKTINAAYDILTDPVKKFDFDQAWARAEAAVRGSSRYASSHGPSNDQQPHPKPPPSPPPTPPPPRQETTQSANQRPEKRRVRYKPIVGLIVLVAFIWGLPETSDHASNEVAPTVPATRPTVPIREMGGMVTPLADGPGRSLSTEEVASRPAKTPRPGDTPVPCEGWSVWYETVVELDRQLSDINEQISQTPAPTESDFRSWANAINQQKTVLNLLDAPREVFELHQEKRELRELQANWLKAQADKRYGFHESQFQRFIKRLDDSRQLTEEANVACAPLSPTATAEFVEEPLRNRAE